MTEMKMFEDLYKELMELNKDYSFIEIRRITPINPWIMEFRVVFKIRTLVEPKPTFRDETVCILSVPNDYPERQLHISVDNMSAPYHPNWYKSGVWDIGNLCSRVLNMIITPAMSLIGCAKSLQFDEKFTRIDSVSNDYAAQFWKDHRDDRSIFPTDTKDLNIITSSTINSNRMTSNRRLLMPPLPERSKKTVQH